MISPELIRKFKKYYNYHIGRPFVVKPSIPIIYFGDEVAYRESLIKVVTVGLNPSDIEFKEGSKPYSTALRFPSYSKSAGTDQDLVKALNEYFYKSNNPYRWFDCYEPLLNGMNSSYSQKFNNTALHTDICSPIATNPTWSDLQHFEKNALMNNSPEIPGGIQLWAELIEELVPDFILMSVRREYLERYLASGYVKLIGRSIFDSLKNKSNGEPRKRPYNIEINEILLNSGKKSRIVFGRSNIKPFMDLSDEVKKSLGSRIINNL